MHEETLNQLQQATQVLNDLQSAHVEDNIDDLYAEVVQLQEKLRYIDEQLERLDEEQWLKDILQELTIVLKKLGLPMP